MFLKVCSLIYSNHNIPFINSSLYIWNFQIKMCFNSLTYIVITTI